MAKRNLNTVLLWHNGEPLKDRAGPEGVEITARPIILAGLCNGPMVADPQVEGGLRPKPISGAEKYEMYKLMRKIEAEGNIVDLKSDEIRIIRQCIEHLPPVTYGAISDVLETDMKETAHDEP